LEKKLVKKMTEKKEKYETKEISEETIDLLIK
jgi:hypothetical protein